jgi:hypothetical protein
VIVDQKIIFNPQSQEKSYLAITRTMNELTDFLVDIGEEVLDVEEGTPRTLYQEPIRTNKLIEAFLLFAQDVASNNLGMIDSRAPSIELSINDNEYTIHQSPSLLSSHRAGGTTGAGMYDLHDFPSRARTPAPQVLSVRVQARAL